MTPAKLPASQLQPTERVRVYGREWVVMAPYRRHGEVGTLHLRSGDDDNFLVCYADETFTLAAPGS